MAVVHRYVEEPSTGRKVVRALLVVGLIVTYVLIFLSLIITYRTAQQVKANQHDRAVDIDRAVCTLLALIPKGESGQVDNLRITFDCEQFGTIVIPKKPKATVSEAPVTPRATVTETVPPPRTTTHRRAESPPVSKRHHEHTVRPTPRRTPTPVSKPISKPVPKPKTSTPNEPLLPILGKPLCTIVGICV